MFRALLTRVKGSSMCDETLLVLSVLWMHAHASSHCLVSATMSDSIFLNSLTVLIPWIAVPCPSSRAIPSNECSSTESFHSFPQTGSRQCQLRLGQGGASSLRGCSRYFSPMRFKERCRLKLSDSFQLVNKYCRCQSRRFLRSHSRRDDEVLSSA